MSTEHGFVPSDETLTQAVAESQGRAPREVMLYEIEAGKLYGYVASGSHGVGGPRHVPAGVYAEDISEGLIRGDFLCLRQIDLQTPELWLVNEAEADRYARPWGPIDHEGPRPGKCFLGLNFSDAEWKPVGEAMVAAMTEAGTALPEPALVAICQSWLQARKAIREMLL